MSAALHETVFAFSTTAHSRRRGPHGYVDYTSFKPWLRDEFSFRCVYCLWRERWGKDADGGFSIDHVEAQAVALARICEYANLVYSCLACNSNKRDNRLPDPCEMAFGKLLRMREDGSFEGLNSAGRRMIDLLNLNRTEVTEFRRRLLDTLRILASVKRRSYSNLLQQWLAYPETLPDLEALNPPGNTRPEGVSESHYARRQAGLLPDLY